MAGRRGDVVILRTPLLRRLALEDDASPRRPVQTIGARLRALGVRTVGVP